jgi:5'-3' exonuclease
LISFQSHLARPYDKGDRIDEMDNDPVRLGEEGWKGRYYATKMHATDENAEEVVRAMVTEYVRGLYWVCRYYYEAGTATHDILASLFHV